MKGTLLVIAAGLGILMMVPGVSRQALAQGGRVSPHDTVSLTFADGKKITIQYGRPRMKDPRTGQPRKIFGALVPYDQPWRAGADEATSFVTQADLDIAGTRVPAGSYTLFTIPRENGNWTLIISKETGEWGIPYPGQDKDFARIDAMQAKKISAPVEQFTISFEKTAPNAALLKMAWENTEASIPLKER